MRLIGVASVLVLLQSGAHGDEVTRPVALHCALGIIRSDLSDLSTSVRQAPVSQLEKFLFRRGHRALGHKFIFIAGSELEVTVDVGPNVLDDPHGGWLLRRAKPKVSELTVEWHGPKGPFQWKLDRQSLHLFGEYSWEDEIEGKRGHETEHLRCALVDHDKARSHIAQQRNLYEARLEAERREKVGDRKF